jgi:hypothetical protein
MVDETRTGWLAAEVTRQDDAPFAVATYVAEVTHQTTQFYPLQFASGYIEVTHQTHDVYQTEFASIHAEVLRSLGDLLKFDLLVRPSDSEIWPIGELDYEAPTRPGPVARATSLELNPYRPDVPNKLAAEDPELYEYLREQAELLRQQHNLTQAGDSTFPWEVATLPADKAEFTLGSMTRFVHPQMGLISGRFVQYAADTVQPTLMLGSDRGGTEWVGSQTLKRTSIWRPLGLNLASGDVAGKYGWVMTHGRAPVTITVESDGPIVADQSLTWDPANPAILVVGPGPEVARIIDPTPAIVTVPTTKGKKAWILPAGTWSVGLNGGVTPEYIDQRVRPFLIPIEAEIAELQKAIAAIEDNDYAAAIEALGRQQVLFEQRLEAESKSRNTTDANLNRKIETLNEAVGRLASGGGTGGDLTGVYQEIDSLKSLVERTKARDDERLKALELWRSTAEQTIESLLASANQQLRPQPWAMQAEGTGDPQAILLPSSGLVVTQVFVYVNGLKWPTTEYTITEQELTITTNAAGDLIEIIGF